MWENEIDYEGIKTNIIRQIKKNKKDGKYAIWMWMTNRKITKNKNFETDPITILNSTKIIEDYSVEKILFLEPKNFIFENENITALIGIKLVQSDEELSLNYFLEDGSKLEKVEQGKIYLTEENSENST